MIIKELRFVDPYDFPPDKVIKWKNDVIGIKALAIFKSNKTGKKYIDTIIVASPGRRSDEDNDKYGFMNKIYDREITHWCPIPEIE
ncbi:MAG TPA: hypothetical protein PLI87_22480 [bacterium]|nr:hypothetical protein [bacterium]